MQNPVRGKVLIINNEFKGMTNKRLGSEKDVEILTKIFQELHFDVESNNEDLTATVNVIVFKMLLDVRD